MKRSFVTVLKREGHSMTCRTTQGSPRVGQDAEGVREKHGKEPLLQFSWEGMGETGSAGQTGLGWTRLNNFRGLMGVGTVPSCLVTHP